VELHWLGIWWEREIDPSIDSYCLLDAEGSIPYFYFSFVCTLHDTPLLQIYQASSACVGEEALVCRSMSTDQNPILVDELLAEWRVKVPSVERDMIVS